MNRLSVAGKRYDVVTLDFETFYSKDYTLSKLSTSEYIRDARFHAHGVGIKINAKPTKWYTGENIRLALQQINWSKSAMLGHHTQFDGFICSHWWQINPAFYLDTLSMSRAVHGHHVKHSLDALAKRHGLAGKVRAGALANTKDKLELTSDEQAFLGGYCCDDVEDTYALFWKMLPYISDDELRLIDITMRMFCQPKLLVDIPRVEAELKREIGAKFSALETAGAKVESLMSNAQFAALLRSAGATLPMKISPTTGELTYAFAKNDLEFQALAESKNFKIAALCKARLKVKSTIGETRAVRFIEAGKDGMCLPVYLNYCGAHTYRWSGGNKLNLQNLPRSGELRKAIVTALGYVIVVADSAQIEARTLAELAGQTDLVEAFRQKRDLYSEFASEIFGFTVNKNDHPDERFVGKVAILLLGYGGGAAKLEQTLNSGAAGKKLTLSEDMYQRIINLYRTKNFKIRALWKICDGIIEQMALGIEGEYGPITWGKGYIRLPNGLFLHYPGLKGEIDDRGVFRNVEYWNGRMHTRLYGAMLVENIVQALARCIVAEQMLVIHDAGYPIVTMSHDEIVALAPAKRGQRALDFMIKTMSTPPVWMPNLPLAAEGSFAENYSK